VLALSGTASAQPRPTPTASGERIGIIDLGRDGAEERSARRAELARALAGVPGLRPVDDPDLARALAGEDPDPQLAAGRAALARASTAFGALDCAHARGEAEPAVLALAAAQAAGGEVTAELRRAHSIRFLCADQGGDRGAAQSAAAALRQLRAGDPPAGIGDAVWSRYPAVDAATGVQKGQLAITTQPPGAAIWIDHAPAGTSPVTVTLPEGEHLVAAGRAGGAVARRVTVKPGWTPARLALALPPGGGARWTQVAAQVRAWREGKSRPDPAAIGALLARAGLAHAVVLDPRGKLAVWRLPPRRKAASHLGNAADAAAIGTLVGGRPRGPGIDPSQPLLRETPEERAVAQGKTSGIADSKQEWWVYAAIIGAVAIGAGIVVAQDLGDDSQRIEITFP
jgi:hypothetical protein